MMSNGNRFHRRAGIPHRRVSKSVRNMPYRHLIRGWCFPILASIFRGTVPVYAIYQYRDLDVRLDMEDVGKRCQSRRMYASSPGENGIYGSGEKVGTIHAPCDVWVRTGTLVPPGGSFIRTPCWPWRPRSPRGPPPFRSSRRTSSCSGSRSRFRRCSRRGPGAIPPNRGWSRIRAAGT